MCCRVFYFVSHEKSCGPSVSNNPNYNQTFYWNGQGPSYGGQIPPTFNGQTPNYGGQYPTNWNGQTPSWSGQNPPNWNGQNPTNWNGQQPSNWNNQNPTYNGQYPSTNNGQNPPNWNGNPSTFGPQIPPTWNEGQDTNEIETFYEIGSSNSRPKREVKFPEDDENVSNIPAIDDDNRTINNRTIDDVIVETIPSSDERALKQMMQSVTKIDVGAQSQLFVAPGSTSVIYFEVTNLRNEPTYHNFNVQDEKRFLRQMEPRFIWLQPNQKESIRVTILVPQGTESGMKDVITLTSQSVIQTQQSVVVTVATNGVVDAWQPRLWYTYNTRCDWRWNCVGGVWSIEVVARDYESGLLSLKSNPEGLLLRAPFTAGTNEEVTATYSASCCEPRVTITAYDLNRNQRTIQLNVDEPWLSEYGIATVVLACLFLILLIILIVIWVRWCINRRRMARDIPSYRPGDRFTDPPRASSNANI